jgi:hypothetical protein
MNAPTDERRHLGDRMNAPIDERRYHEVDERSHHGMKSSSSSSSSWEHRS